MQNLVSLYEYSTLKYQICNDLASEGLDENTKVLHITDDSLQKLNKLIEDVNFLEIYHDRIRTLNYVGVAKIGSLKFEILPKFFKTGNIEETKPKIMRNLLYMLQYSEIFNFKEVSYADLDEIKNDFLEVIVYLFAKNLAQLLKNKQERQYIRHQGDLRFVREKIIMKKYGTNPARLHIIPCDFHDRSMDTLMNQTFKYTAQVLLHQVKNPETYRHFKFILSVFDEVPPGRVFSTEIRKIRFNRMNLVFRPYVKFCELFLSHSTLTLQASKVDFFSLMIPMQKLFESFIAEMIMKYRNTILPLGSAYDIVPQYHMGPLAFDSERGYFEMIPDIFFKGTPQIVLDTKYKLLSNEDKKSNISQPDLYQMYAYCRESGTKTAILLYPASINTEIPERVFTLGREDLIKLYVKTISLDFDLSNEEEIGQFINELAKKFAFLQQSTELQIMGNTVEGLS
jgi:5-methylcytosine-specific restriction enzyme subunit McrC